MGMFGLGNGRWDTAQPASWLPDLPASADGNDTGATEPDGGENSNRARHVINGVGGGA